MGEVEGLVSGLIEQEGVCGAHIFPTSVNPAIALDEKSVGASGFWSHEIAAVFTNVRTLRVCTVLFPWLPEGTRSGEFGTFAPCRGHISPSRADSSHGTGTSREML